MKRIDKVGHLKQHRSLQLAAAEVENGNDHQKALAIQPSDQASYSNRPGLLQQLHQGFGSAVMAGLVLLVDGHRDGIVQMALTDTAGAKQRHVLGLHQSGVFS